MFDPNKLILEEINFENRTEVYQFIAQMHAHYTTKPLNIVMQEKLINGIYDKRLPAITNFELLRESYNRWMLVEDQPTKQTFVYLFGIFKNMKDAYLLETFKKQKEQDKITASAQRAVRAAEERKEEKAEADALYKLLKTNKSKFDEDKIQLIYGLLKTNKLLRARIEIEKVVGVE
jgi:hypothetical protein